MNTPFVTVEVIRALTLCQIIMYVKVCIIRALLIIDVDQINCMIHHLSSE